jgi:hypothetical protein
MQPPAGAGGVADRAGQLVGDDQEGPLTEHGALDRDRIGLVSDVDRGSTILPMILGWAWLVVSRTSVWVMAPSRRGSRPR